MDSSLFQQKSVKQFRKFLKITRIPYWGVLGQLKLQISEHSRLCYICHQHKSSRSLSNQKTTKHTHISDLICLSWYLAFCYNNPNDCSLHSSHPPCFGHSDTDHCRMSFAEPKEPQQEACAAAACQLMITQGKHSKTNSQVTSLTHFFLSSLHLAISSGLSNFILLAQGACA